MLDEPTKGRDAIASRMSPGGLHCRANSVRGNTDTSNRSYAPVEAVRRSLMLLRILNSLRIASVGQLHQATGLSKSTIVRLLETLISEGYVVRDNFFGGYRVTSQVQALSSGFDGAPMVIEAARPWAVELTQSMKWPVSIGTLSEGGILINFTTASISPLAYPFHVLHARLDITSSAMGRCYLAFCQEEEREALMNAESARCKSEGRGFNRVRVSRAVRDARSQGYSLSDPMNRPRQFQFVAVPIQYDGTCVAVLGAGYFRRAVPSAQVTERVFQPMRVAAESMAFDFHALKNSA